MENQNEPSSNPPERRKPSPEPKPKSKNLLVPVLLSVLVSALVVGGVVYAWQNKKVNDLKKEKDEKIEALEEQIDTLEEGLNALKEQANSSEEKEDEKKGSEMIKLDSTWNKYINHNLNFSIKFPKEVRGNNPFCKDEGYKMTPVKICEGSNVVYITEKYFYREDSCKRAESTFSKLENQEIDKDPHRASWKIITQEVKNQEEVEKFVKKHYGESCGIELEANPNRKKVYNVNIKGSLKGECRINFMYVIRYDFLLNKVVAWNMGQDNEFFATPEKAYDSQMKDSFRFLR